MKEMIPSATGVQALSKTSSSDEIRAYFEAILNLSKSNEQFPVNLDEVWPLVYSEKWKAVNELRNTKNEDGTPRYVEGIDYQSINQKKKAGHTYTTTHVYKLSISCMEWFIARKVRPVFDVYRQVFHKVATQPQLPQSYAESLRLAADQADKIEQQQKQLEAQEPAVIFTQAVSNSTGNILIRDLAKLLCQNGIDTGEHRLYDWMVENKYLIRSNRWSKSKRRNVPDYFPTQRSAELKVFFVNETVIMPGDKSFVKHTCHITPKGQTYFINKFLNQKTA